MLLSGFNPRVPVWDATFWRTGCRQRGMFQSARPVWDATVRLVPRAFLPPMFQSARPCGTRPASRRVAAAGSTVSIRASRVGRDMVMCGSAGCSTSFNPRVPCGTRLMGPIRTKASSHSFNPRVPCGTRRTAAGKLMLLSGFNPRVPCGTRQRSRSAIVHELPVSIRASRVGRDKPISTLGKIFTEFQSARPVWDATRAHQQTNLRLSVSIRASRVGRDRHHYELHESSYVSIRASRVGRDCVRSASLSCSDGFQSARPVWDATCGRTQAS